MCRELPILTMDDFEEDELRELAALRNYRALCLVQNDLISDFHEEDRESYRFDIAAEIKGLDKRKMHIEHGAGHRKSMKACGFG